MGLESTFEYLVPGEEFSLGIEEFELLKQSEPRIQKILLLLDVTRIYILRIRVNLYTWHSREFSIGTGHIMHLKSLTTNKLAIIPTWALLEGKVTSKEFR